MDKKPYVTMELCICLLSNTDVVRTSSTARDKFNDDWKPGTDDFVQITN
jgi:hypothetical protein